MTARWEMPITLTVRSPFIFSGLRGYEVGVDRSALRDEPDGRPLLPGDQVKGLLRLAMAHLPAEALEGLSIRMLLGPEHGENSLDQAERGLLRFSDFAADAPEGAEGEKRRKAIVTRIKIDEDAGIAEDGHIVSIELVAPMGAEVEFSGVAHFFGDDGDKVRRVVEKALKIVPHFGSARSVGFGEHVAERLEVGAPTLTSLSTARSGGVEGDRLVIVGEFDCPFLVASERLADNLVRGAQIVPGGVLKGALAQMLERGGRDVTTPGAPYEAALRALRLSHAFPLDDNGHEMGRAIPFSVMAHPRTCQLACAFEVSTPGVFEEDGACADFGPDWKNEREIAERLRRPTAQLAQHERGHVKLGRESGAAEAGLLFVEISRGRYKGPDREGQRVQFTADFVHCPTTAAEAKEALREIRAVLSSALWDIGKTSATLALVASHQPSSVEPGPPPWRVLLETDGVLVDLETRPDMEPADQLARYFSHIAPGAILDRYFVQRRLIGGFQARRFKNGAYRPFSLFRAGSSFLLRPAPGGETSVAMALTKLTRHGLPVCTWQDDTLVDQCDWRVMPFLPENGYGAISANDPVFARIKGSGS